MSLLRLFGFLSLLALATSLRAQIPALTPQGPVETLSTARARIVLNGLWAFQPAVDAAATQPTGDWGTLRVPGSWLGRNHWAHPSLPGIETKGTSPLWTKAGENLQAGWYERSIELPAGWTGRRIELDLLRVSTNAKVWLNGLPCGEARWPFGKVDLTAAAKPGSNQLLILVIATNDTAEHIDYMGYAAESKSKASLNSAGLIGDVILNSLPPSGVVTDVFVKPSVRRSELGVEVELGRVKQAGPVQLTFTARLEGSEAVAFRAESTVQAAAAERQSFDLTFPWADAQRWDLDQPHLYTLTVEASGEGVSDACAQRFGFREFWIEGRNFILNGTRINLRPSLLPGSHLNGDRATLDGLFSGLRSTGYNISQIWPEPIESRRGSPHFWDLAYARASEAGWPMIGVYPSLNDFFQDSSGNTSWASRRSEYTALSEAVIRRVRNEPSILLWGTTGNYFNHGGDQDPANIGRSDYRATPGLLHPRDADWRDALKIIRATDPTRPLFTHAGNIYGDVYTANHYLNFIPLQEREEWLTAWAKDGDMPYLAVEFGTPFNINLFRGRNGYGNASQSEPLLTEFLAPYFGSAAYRAETIDYKRQIVQMKHKKDQQWEMMQNEPLMTYHPQFQELQALFVRNTWRSWRTDGISGGMIPWSSDAILWRRGEPPAPAAAPAPVPFVPGTLGIYNPMPNPAALNFLTKEGGFKLLPGGEALIANNGPTLAWIAGAPDIHDKAHAFSPGETIAKQAALLNDLRAPADYSLTWSAEIDGKVIAQGKVSGSIAPADRVLSPVSFTAPAIPAGQRASGQIKLTATIAGRSHTDTFPFRVFTAAPVYKATWLVFDPTGDTSAYLATQGIKTAPWNGNPARNAVLAIGRHALDSETALPGDMQAFAAAGGRVVVFGQSPDWYRSIGLRVSRYVSRRVFPIAADHPLTAGLTAEDLRDWRGSGTLIQPRPAYAKDRIPPFGWHWGNRHSVSSAALEKPHRSGWRPILECEFDLAYSPLLELDLGLGRVWLCTLDFEGRDQADPAADTLFRQFARYVAESPARPRAAKTVYLGNDSGASLLRSLAVNFTKTTTLPDDATLAIIGAEANVTPAALTAWAAAGRNVFVLPADKGGINHFGADIVLTTRFGGSLNLPPSPLGDGLSLSDLHFRSTVDARLVGPAGPATVYADGLLASQSSGKGLVVYSQLNPRMVDLEAKPYLRYTAWRLTRANAQVLANLGATFSTDSQFFKPRLERISLAGDWRAKLTTALPSRGSELTRNLDPGISPAATAAVRPGFDTSASDWSTVKLPGAWKPVLDANDGEAVFVRRISIPVSWAGQVLLLSLGKIDNFDTAFIDGIVVGETPQKPEDPKFNPWNVRREYRIEAGKITSRYLTIAVRVFDQDSGGGITGLDEELYLRALDPSIRQESTFYSPDFREDHALGDDPYRYYRW
jgi:beta-galactosidase